MLCVVLGGELRLSWRRKQFDLVTLIDWVCSIRTAFGWNLVRLPT